jgi:hypothetical protein
MANELIKTFYLGDRLLCQSNVETHSRFRKYLLMFRLKMIGIFLWQ